MKYELPEVKAQDVAKVTNYMMTFHCGHENAATRNKIVSVLGMDDRYFRLVCSVIPEILTSHRRGYWILPLVDATGEETKIALETQKEDRRRIISDYLRMKRRKQAIKRMSEKAKQFTFAGV